MTWLITGGAGYIGAHVVRETIASGRSAVVFDDLSTGLANRVPDDVSLVHANITDSLAVLEIFEKYDITGVLHLAARKQVGESVAKPIYYWEENVVGFFNVLTAMQKHGVKNLVFSSSAAVYGQPDNGVDTLITEDAPCLPINPYGATKLAGESLSEALSESDGFKVAALRYFNVAGAGDATLGDPFALNLIPIIFQALTSGEQPQVFGTDYPTPDGTCIRDYIHVQDLAQAHIAAMNLVENSQATFIPINIGTGSGASVLEVFKKVREVTGLEVDPVLTARRPGDPAALVADTNFAKSVLNWSSQKSLHDMVSSAWEAWQARNTIGP